MQRIFRDNPKFHWTKLSNKLLQSAPLSPKAFSLLCYALSQPPAWNTTLDELNERFPRSLRMVQSGIKELEAKGYLKRIPKAWGRGYDWQWFESPDTPTNVGANTPTNVSPIKNKERRPRKTKSMKRLAKPHQVSFLSAPTNIPTKAEFMEWIPANLLEALKGHEEQAWNDLQNAKWHVWSNLSKAPKPLTDWKGYLVTLNTEIATKRL